MPHDNQGTNRGDHVSRRSLLQASAVLAGSSAIGETTAAAGKFDYPGRDDDADWRTEAGERIDKHRKADLEVTVVDGNGEPIEDADVDVEMQQHEFNFGTAVNTWKLRQQNEDGRTLREKLPQDINYATTERNFFAGKWETGAKGNVQWGIDWFNDNDIGVRAHAALWETWDRMNMNEGSEDYHADLSNWEIFKTVQEKIRERVSAVAGEVDAWDMQNHPYHLQQIRNEIAGSSGVDEAVKWWETAHEADPDAKMGINEQNLIQQYSWANGDKWRGKVHWWIKQLLDNDVDVEGIGMMAHAQLGRLAGIPRALEILDEFAEYDIPIYISEFHVTFPNWWNKTWEQASEAEKQAQVDYVRDFLTACFSHPAVETFTHWTYWEGLAWRKTSALYGRDWTLRDHGEEWRRLVYDEWWTDESGQTDADGTYSTRGFNGEYEITVSDGDRSRTATTTLSDGGQSVEVRFFDPDAQYRIEAAHSGKVLDVDGGDRNNGADVQQWADAGTDDQRWYIEHTEDGKHRIEAAHSGKVLDVAGDGSTDDGANVRQWEGYGLDHQRWRIEPDGDGTCHIEAAHSGKVLDVDGGRQDNGRNVQQWEDAGAANQRWRIERNSGSKTHYLNAERYDLEGTETATDREGFWGDGYVTGFTRTGDSVTVQFESAIAGARKRAVTVRYASPYDDKQCALSINGTQVDTPILPQTEEFQETTIGFYGFEEGTNEITIEKGWGYYEIDAIMVED